MAEDAARWLTSQGADLSSELVALQLTPLPLRSRRDVLHQSVASLTDALLA